MVLAACSTSARARPAEPLGPIPVAPHPGVVAVAASGGAPGEVSTGFFVGPGLVATTRHGVAGRSRVSVRFPEGKRVAARSLLAESQAHDLAMLEVGDEVAAPALRFSERPPRVGDSLRIVWARTSRTQRTDRGVVAREEAYLAPWGAVFGIRAQLALGCSGAPVLDADGRVVGVVVAGDPERGYFYAVPARFVRTLATGLAANPPKPASGAAHR